MHSQRSKRFLFVGAVIAIAGGVLAVLAGSLRIAEEVHVRKRGSSVAPERRIPEPVRLDALPERVPSEHEILLHDVRLRFRTRAGIPVIPCAFLIASSGGVYPLLSSPGSPWMRPKTPIPPGEYRARAEHTLSGWARELAVPIPSDGEYELEFDPPVEPLRILVLGPDGSPHVGSLRYRLSERPRFSEYALRRRLRILDLAFGDDVASGLPAPGEWTNATGPTFEIVRHHGATVGLEVEASGGLTSRAWLSPLAGVSEAVVRLADCKEAIFHVAVDGRRARAGCIVNAIAAGSLTHEDWQGVVDNDGVARVRNYPPSPLPAFLLFEGSKDANGLPLSYVTVPDATDAFMLGSLMLSPSGAALRFRHYDRVEWQVRVPEELVAEVRAVEVWTMRTTNEGRMALPMARLGSVAVEARQRAITLPAYVANSDIQLSLAPPLSGVTLRVDMGRRVITADSVTMLKGLVVDTSGVPIPGISVLWSPVSEGAADPALQTYAFRRAESTTDGEGLFSFYVGPSTPGVLRTWAPGFAVAEWRVENPGSHSIQLTVSRTPMATIRLEPHDAARGARAEIMYPALGRVDYGFDESGMAVVPLHRGPGRHSIELWIPAQTVRVLGDFALQESEVTRIALPVPVARRHVRVVAAQALMPLELAVRWRGTQASFEVADRVTGDGVTLPFPADSTQLRVAIRGLRTTASHTDALSAFELWRWTGRASEFPGVIDLRGESVSEMRVTPGGRDVLLQVQLTSGETHQFAVPAVGHDVVVRLPAARPPYFVGAVAGLSVRYDLLPQQLYAAAFLVDRTVRLDPRLHASLRGGEWTLMLRGFPVSNDLVMSSRELKPLLAPEGGTGSGVIRNTDSDEFPVRAKVEGREILVEPAGWDESDR